MRRLILESPYAAADQYELQRNLAYARQCVRACLLEGSTVLASHLLFTQHGILDDRKPNERRLGIEAGLAWGPHADATVVWVDRGVSEGMRQGIARAEAEGRPVEYRSLINPRGRSA